MKGNCLIYLVIFIIIGIILLKSNVLYKSSSILEKFMAGAARWQRRRRPWASDVRSYLIQDLEQDLD